MTIAKQRQELIDQNLEIPIINGMGESQCTQIPDWLPSYQPKGIEDAEFNTILKLPNGSLIRASSIDLEFNNPEQ